MLRSWWEMLEWYRMIAETLKGCNKRHLAQMAKEQGIVGWHAMRKDQLIRALSHPRSSSRAPARAKPALLNGSASNGTASGRSTSRKKHNGALVARGQRGAVNRSSLGSLPSTPPQTLDHACQKDRII